MDTKMGVVLESNLLVNPWLLLLFVGGMGS